MRLAAVLAALALAACTPAGDEPPEQPGATPADLPTVAAPGQELPAAVPTGPSLVDFRRETTLACRAAADEIARAPLEGDPFADGARPRHVRAAVAHYRAASRAWAGAANRMWEYGLPARPAAQRLVAALDTLAQYSEQAANAVRSGERDEAQAAVGAADDALQEVNRLAARLGVEPFDECARTRRRLRNATRVRVIAHDHFFAVADPGRGPTRFVLRNEGLEPHQLFVVRLRRGASVADAVAADRRGEPPGRYLARRGVTSRVVQPGDRATVDARLRPGRYALLCFVASPDGTPHAYKGMATERTVQ